MGSESIAHEAEGRMGYWLRDFGIDWCNNVLKYSSETSAKRDSAPIVLIFSPLVGYNN